MKDIFVEQFIVLINSALFQLIHAMTNLADLSQID